MQLSEQAVDHTIMVAEPHCAERVYDALTLAFVNDPANRWMFPEPARYLRHFPAFAQALGGAALSERTAFVDPDYSAVALWLAPGVHSDEDALAKLIEEGVAPEKSADLAGVIDEMTRLHPKEPHWYLPFIGVDPARQGNGLGGALLQPILEQCDRDRLPAYLESTTPRNRPLYRRNGFEAVGEIKVGTCPPIVPMLRRPRPA